MPVLWHIGNIQLPNSAMSWTGFATDLTLDDVIGPPRECAPTPQSAQATAVPPQAQQLTPSTASTPARQAPDPIRYQAPPAKGAGGAARPQPHVHVTEDMLPPAVRARLPGGRRSHMPWLVGTIGLAVVALVAGVLVTSTPHAPAEDPVRIPASAYEFSGSTKPQPAVTADDATPVESLGRPAAPARSRQALTRRPKGETPAGDATEDAASAPGDIDIEKFRQLSGKI
jgi:hypothetical protein